MDWIAEYLDETGFRESWSLFDLDSRVKYYRWLIKKNYGVDV